MKVKVMIAFLMQFTSLLLLLCQLWKRPRQRDSLSLSRLAIIISGFQGCCNYALLNMIMGWRQRHMIHICKSGCSIKDQMTTLIHESFVRHSINFLLLFSRIWEFVCSHFYDISIITITFMSDDIFSSVWQLRRFPPEPLNTNAVLQSGAGE